MSAARFGGPRRRPSKPRSISPHRVGAQRVDRMDTARCIPKKKLGRSRKHRSELDPNVKAGEQTESEGATGRMDPAGKGCPHEWATTRFRPADPWRANSRCTLPIAPDQAELPIRSNASSATSTWRSLPARAEAANASAIAMSEPKGPALELPGRLFRIRGNRATRKPSESRSGDMRRDHLRRMPGFLRFVHSRFIHVLLSMGRRAALFGMRSPRLFFTLEDARSSPRLTIPGSLMRPSSIATVLLPIQASNRAKSTIRGKSALIAPKRGDLDYLL